MDTFHTGQGFIGHIIDDAQCEIILRFKGFQVFKGSYDIARQEFLGSNTITAMINLRRPVSSGKSSGDAVV